MDWGEPVGGWPQDDEGYWQALLEQGEVAAPWPAAVRPPRATAPVTAGNAVAQAEKEASAPPSGEWQRLQNAMAKGEALHLPVIGHNRGGLLVRCGSLEGFVPASHLTDLPRQLKPAERLEELARRKGQELDLYVIEVDPAQNRLVLSPRGPRPANRGEEALHSIRPGSILKGQVTNVCDFGAFVDLGGVEGLVHISEISWGRVHHPSDLLQPGQEVEVYVLSVDPAQERVALSLKRLHEDPWATVEERYHPGQIVQGVVTNVVDFGAFVKLEEGLEGLIHISQLAEDGVSDPRNVLHEGEEVTARILHIDGAHRRLGLSLRLLPEEEALGGDT
ncbi:MAG: 30S ribosomal protein S1 [Anaerolineae bacterium]